MFTRYLCVNNTRLLNSLPGVGSMLFLYTRWLFLLLLVLGVLDEATTQVWNTVVLILCVLCFMFLSGVYSVLCDRITCDIFYDFYLGSLCSLSLCFCTH